MTNRLAALVALVALLAAGTGARPLVCRSTRNPDASLAAK